MADLYQVYGGLGNSPGSANSGGFNNTSEPSRNVQREDYANDSDIYEEPPAPVQKKQKLSMKDSGGSSGKEHFQNLHNQEYAQPPQPTQRNSYSFWDKMSMKRGDIIKLAVFSLVIVLGISLDRITTHYLSRYVSDNILTDFQEFMIRLAYPVVVILVIWVIKSL
jgi:hypothetical protein